MDFSGFSYVPGWHPAEGQTTFTITTTSDGSDITYYPNVSPSSETITITLPNTYSGDTIRIEPGEPYVLENPHMGEWVSDGVQWVPASEAQWREVFQEARRVGPTPTSSDRQREHNKKKRKGSQCEFLFVFEECV